MTASKQHLAPQVMAAVTVVSIAAVIIVMMAGVVFYFAIGLLGDGTVSEIWGNGALVIGLVLLGIAALALVGIRGLARNADYGRLILTFTGGLGLIATIALLATVSLGSFRGMGTSGIVVLASVLLVVGGVLAWVPTAKASGPVSRV